MAEPARGVLGGEGPVEPEAYRQQLRQALGSLQVIGDSFARLSVAVGISGTDDEMLQKGEAVGQTAEAPVYAPC